MKPFDVKILINLRKQRGLTQEQIAGKIGITRQSYFAIEKGKRELTISEANIISDMLGVTIDQLADGIIPNDEKYKQMIFAFLRSDVEVDGKVTKTKLAKLLYLADFGWFYNNLKSMSNMPYRKIQHGPVPDPYFRIIDELSENGEIDVDATKNGAMLISETKSGGRREINLLSKKEQAFIAKVAMNWEGKKTQDIVKFTHDQLPYQVCSEGEVIPYELITQEDPNYVY